MEDEVEIRKIEGLKLILKSINCEKYKPKFESHGINEDHTVIQLTADELRNLDLDNKDIYTILSATNTLNKTLKHSEIKLLSITNDNSTLNDMLIDKYTSPIDAALTLRPEMRAAEKKH